MAHIQDRWYKTIRHPDGSTERVKTELFGTGDRYRLRYIGPDGREKSESFPDRQKRRAEDRLVEVESNKRRGTYVDPAAGKITFKRYADQWLAAATSSELTLVRMESEFRLHVYPHLGGLPLAAIQPETIRAWSRRLQEAGLAASTRRILFTDVATILNAAVDDKRIPSSPFKVKSVRAPAVQQTKIVPWSGEQRRKVRSALPERYRLAVDLGAGCGLRQGEIFATSPDDVDPLRPVLHVVRQIKVVRRQLVFAPPKGGKTREVPLPESVARRLREHAKQIAPLPFTLPWDTSDGDPRTVPLYLYSANLAAIHRSGFNTTVWKPALQAAGVEDNRQNGMHALRHMYASVLLDAGESVKALAAYLGHSDPGFTLRIYTHLLPNSEERTRTAIDTAFEGDPQAADGLETA
jgi:integrase